MTSTIYKIKSKIWLYPGMAAWHFVTIPKEKGIEIKKLFGSKIKKGWGSIPVAITLGKTRWKTSIFPDKQSGSYLLPLKFDVRKKENIFDGDTATFSLRILRS